MSASHIRQRGSSTAATAKVLKSLRSLAISRPDEISHFFRSATLVHMSAHRENPWDILPFFVRGFNGQAYPLGVLSYSYLQLPKRDWNQYRRRESERG